MSRKPGIAAVGTFDGLHKGHQAVLDAVAERAIRRDGVGFIISFDRHPLTLVNPSRAPKALLTEEKKIRRLKEKGLTTEIFKFDNELKSLTASQWLKLLKEKLGIDEIILGYDNTFGSDGVDLSVEDYKKIASSLGMEIRVAPYVEGASSSEVRKLISKGEIEKANEILGYPYTLEGEVGNGKHIGRTLGFPTANLSPDPSLVMPGQGVYAAAALLPSGEKVAAMVNIGVNPTVGKIVQPSIEAHLIGWEGNLYGCKLELIFLKRLRDEMKFASLSELGNQLEKDREETLKVFSASANNLAEL